MNTAWKYGCFQLSICPDAEWTGESVAVPIRLAGGPADGAEVLAEPGFCGVLACRTWPDEWAVDGADHYYARTAELTAAGRIICRYSGGRMRG